MLWQERISGQGCAPARENGGKGCVLLRGDAKQQYAPARDIELLTDSGEGSGDGAGRWGGAHIVFALVQNLRPSRAE